MSWYPHQPELHQQGLKKVLDGVCDGHPDPKIGPQVYLGPIKIEIQIQVQTQTQTQTQRPDCIPKLRLAETLSIKCKDNLLQIILCRNIKRQYKNKLRRKCNFPLQQCFPEALL